MTGDCPRHASRRAAAGARLILGILLFAVAASPPARPSGAPAAREQEIRAALERLQEAIRAKKPDAASECFAIADPAESARLLGEIQAAAALDLVSCELHVGSVTVNGERAEAVALSELVYREHDREKEEASWSTYTLQRIEGEWKITAEEDREFAKTNFTDLRLRLEPDKGTLSGTAAIEAEATRPGEDKLVLGLNRGLAIRKLGLAGKEVVPARTGETVIVPLGAPLKRGDKLALEVVFDGSLFNESKESGYSQVSVAPEGCFASWVTSWYPHLAGAASKSEGKLTFDVPAGYVVASSGRPAGKTAKGDREEQIFTVRSPLDFSFAAARYFHRERAVDGVAIGVYFLSGGEAKADLYERQCSKILAFERSLYGMYPFDGYAVVEIPSSATGTLGGSSEQGMNLFPVGMLPDDTVPLPLLGHEMGHSWWGNYVESDDGPIVTEGLAQLTAALCIREFEGESALRRFLKYGWQDYPQCAQMYFSSFAGDPKQDLPLVLSRADSERSAILHDLADTKGHFVFVMLRETIGERAFLAGLRDVLSSHARGSVRLRDLSSAWEKASGKKLDRFFEQWFTRPGAPEFAFAQSIVTEAGKPHLRGSITQVRDEYDADLEVVILGPGGKSTRIVTVSGKDTPFDFPLSETPQAVLFDPDYKVLRWVGEFEQRERMQALASQMSLGHQDAALKGLDAYLVQFPLAPEALYQRGICLEESGGLAEAQKAFRAVCGAYEAYPAFNPWVPVSMLHMGRTCDLLGRREEAVAWYHEVLEMPDASGSRGQAAALLASPFKPPQRPAAPAEDVLKACSGAYANDFFGPADVVYADGALSLTARKSGRKYYLVWSEGLEFTFASHEPVRLRFVTDGRGQVSGAVLSVSGREFTLTRQS